MTANSHKCNIHRCGSLKFYCEIIEIHTAEAGYYTIKSDTSLVIRGYIYENNFTLFDLNINAIKSDVDSGCNGQFKIRLYREMNTSFILAVLTTDELQHGMFSITVHGPRNVSMQRIGTCGFSIEFSTNESSLRVLSFIENEE